MKIKIQRPSPPPLSPPQLEPEETSATIFWKEIAAVMVYAIGIPTKRMIWKGVRSQKPLWESGESRREREEKKRG